MNDQPNDPPWVTRVTLLQRAKDPDDHAAWEEFVRYYEGFIRVVVRQMRMSEADADDVTQSVLVKIWKNLPSFEVDKDRARFRTWLTTVIRNTVYNFTDKDQRRRNRHDDLANEHEAGVASVHRKSVSELETMIDREWEAYVANLAMNNVRPLFSERAMDAFSLSLDGIPMDEIAKRLRARHLIDLVLIELTQATDPQAHFVAEIVAFSLVANVRASA